MAQQPCNNCPFRSDVEFHGLTPDRVEEITDTLMRDGSFHCHKTVDYSRGMEGQVTKNSRHCIGAALFLQKVRPGGYLANLSFRLVFLFNGELKDLDQDFPVYESVEEMIEGAC
jgi:hypothetical protein